MRAMRAAITSMVAVAATVYLIRGSSVFAADLWVYLSFVWLGWYVILDRWAHWNPPVLPGRWFKLRSWEADGRLYRRAGVRPYSALVVDGKFDLRSSGKRVIRSRRDVERWSARTEYSETGHVINFVLLLPAIAAAAIDGRGLTCAGLTALTIFFNVYAIALQRYNRARAAHIQRLQAR